MQDAVLQSLLLSSSCFKYMRIGSFTNFAKVSSPDVVFIFDDCWENTGVLEVAQSAAQMDCSNVCSNTQSVQTVHCSRKAKK